MKTYLALLRGINVSGHKIIKMEDLRNLLEEAGFENVKTYIQSGNVIFDFRETPTELLAKKIRECIAEKYGFEVGVIILTYNELIKAIKDNPFIEDGANLKQLYVTFFSETPLTENIEKWEPDKIHPDIAIITEKVMYLKYFVSAGTSKLSNNLIESKLRVTATSRNWNTTLKLKQLLEERLAN